MVIRALREFGPRAFVLGVDLGTFVAIRGVEEQPAWPEPKNRWQRISVYTADSRIATPHGTPADGLIPRHGDTEQDNLGGLITPR